MFLYDYLKLVISFLYRRRFFYFIQICMIGFTLCFVSYSLSTTYNAYRGIISIHRLVDVPLDKLYNVKFGNIENLSSENAAKIAAFVEELKGSCKIDMVGRFFYDKVNLEYDSDVAINSDVMYIDKDLLPVADIKSAITGENIVLDSLDHIGIAVGSKYKQDMPIGSIWYSSLYDEYYEVTDYISPNEEWFVSDMVDGRGTSSLDSLIISDVSTKVASPDNVFASLVYMNSVYFFSEAYNKNDLANVIRDIANNYNLPVYIVSLDERIDDYLEYNKPYLQRINVKCALFLLVSSVAIFIMALINYNSVKHSVWQMNIFGITYRQIKCVFFIMYAWIYLLAVSIADFINNRYIQLCWGYNLEEKIIIEGLGMLLVIIGFVMNYSVNMYMIKSGIKGNRYND